LVQPTVCNLRIAVLCATDGSSPLYSTSIVQRLLDPLESRLDGSIRSGAALGQLEALVSQEELHAYGLLVSTLDKGNTCFENIFVWHIQCFEALCNPPNEMRYQPGVFAFHMYVHEDLFS
jgi:hypothetical protein